jgi:hypothetical protein
VLKLLYVANIGKRNDRKPAKRCVFDELASVDDELDRWGNNYGRLFCFFPFF